MFAAWRLIYALIRPISAAYPLKLSMSGVGNVKLEWTLEGDNVFVAHQYRHTDNSEGWHPVSGFKFNTSERVKVLNVYPISHGGDPPGYYPADVPITSFTWGSDAAVHRLPKSAAAKVWMEGGTMNGERIAPAGINPWTGEQLITVTPKSFPEFNARPTMIWDYDVLFVGTFDANGACNDNSRVIAGPNQFAVSSLRTIESYIKQGYGIVAGHDTIAGFARAEYGLASLRKYFNIDVGMTEQQCPTCRWRDFWTYQGDGATVIKEGLVTMFPWRLTELRLKIPVTHTLNNMALGTTWIVIDNGVWVSGGDTPTDAKRYFLTTYENTAMIQTGHSLCESTEDERMIIANTLYSLKQRIDSTWSTDYSAFDMEAPVIESYEARRSGVHLLVSLRAKDAESKFSYYVVAHEKSDWTKTIRSETVSIDAASGVSHFIYWFDNQQISPFDPKSDAIGSSGGGVIVHRESRTMIIITPEVSNGKSYVHICAVDRTGNIGLSINVAMNSKYQTVTFSDVTPPKSDADPAPVIASFLIASLSLP